MEKNVLVLALALRLAENTFSAAGFYEKYIAKRANYELESVTDRLRRYVEYTASAVIVYAIVYNKPFDKNMRSLIGSMAIWNLTDAIMPLLVGIL